MLTKEQIAEHLKIAPQRVLNLLWKIGLLERIESPQRHWFDPQTKAKLDEDKLWSCELLPDLIDAYDDQERPPESIRITKIDTKICRRCGKEKGYYDFYDSSKNQDGLTKWCKECLSLFR